MKCSAAELLGLVFIQPSKRRQLVLLACTLAWIDPHSKLFWKHPQIKNIDERPASPQALTGDLAHINRALKLWSTNPSDIHQTLNFILITTHTCSFLTPNRETFSKFFLLCALLFKHIPVKYILHPKMKSLSFLIQPLVVPNLYTVLCSDEHIERYLEECATNSSEAPLTTIVFDI